MNLLGIDWGASRTGIAVTDGSWKVSSPLKTLATGNAVRDIKKIARDYDIGRIVMGLPLSLRERDIKSRWGGFPFFEELKKLTGLPFSWADETFTTSQSHELMEGLKHSRRRSRVDMVSASLILKKYIENALGSKRVVIAVTGNIGTGKSYVAGKLRDEWGCSLIDADEISRDIMRPGQPGSESVRREFGDEFILEDGTLDRRKLGDEVFGDKTKLELLNSLTHPLIRRRMMEEIESVKDKIAVVELPLYAESRLYYMCDFSLLTRTSNDVIITRVKNRDNRLGNNISDILDNQADPRKVEGLFDAVIDTTGDWDSYANEIESFLRCVTSFQEELVHKSAL